MRPNVREMTTTTTDELLAVSTRGVTRVLPAEAATITDVPIAPLPIERFRTVLDHREYGELLGLRASAQELLRGRAVWCVNSTARGGGVAEMLASLLAFTRGAGVDTRWVVVGGDPHFFRVTKRLHNRLHGAIGDGGPLGALALGAQWVAVIRELLA